MAEVASPGAVPAQGLGACAGQCSDEPREGATFRVRHSWGEGFGLMDLMDMLLIQLVSSSM